MTSKPSTPGPHQPRMACPRCGAIFRIVEQYKNNAQLCCHACFSRDNDLVALVPLPDPLTTSNGFTPGHVPNHHANGYATPKIAPGTDQAGKAPTLAFVPAPPAKDPPGSAPSSDTKLGDPVEVWVVCPYGRSLLARFFGPYAPMHAKAFATTLGDRV